MDVLDTQVKQGQQDDDRLLLVPGNIVNNRQIVDIIQVEDLFELEGDHRQGIGIVALPCIQHSWNPPDIAQIQLIILILCTSGREDYRIVWQRFRKIRVIVAGLGPSVASCHHDKLFDRA